MTFLDALKARLKTGFTPDPNFGNPWVVTVSNTQVSCTRPNGRVDSLNWEDLKIVAIETTDGGPCATDVFWHLAGEKTGCVVPIDAVGEDLMVKRLQALPDFDNVAFAEAMTSTSNRTFIVWQEAGAK